MTLISNLQPHSPPPNVTAIKIMFYLLIYSAMPPYICLFVAIAVQCTLYEYITHIVMLHLYNMQASVKWDVWVNRILVFLVFVFEGCRSHEYRCFWIQTISLNTTVWIQTTPLNTGGCVQTTPLYTIAWIQTTPLNTGVWIQTTPADQYLDTD